MARRHRALAPGDGRAAAALALVFLLLVAISWQKWGNPELDAGADLTAAELVANGFEPYGEVRYFYGPAGLYTLALAFKLLGTSLTVAFAFGLLQAAAILAVFHILARNWLTPLPAALATAFLAAIGFSGTLFNFVLPHTNAATFGLLFVLLELLLVVRGRPWLAGAAVGLGLLTRPEFAVFAFAVGLGAVVGQLREAGLREAGRLILALVVPALVVGGGVLAFFAAKVGGERFFFENIVPVDFARVSGNRFQADWAPFTIESLVATVGRGLIWILPVAGAAAALIKLRRSRGLARLIALWPLAAAVAVLVAIDLALRVTGAFPGTRGAVEDDVTRLLFPMSWLPVAAFAALSVSLVGLCRSERPPLSASWVADLALVAGATAFALRAYNDFTTDIYATYFAALPLLVAAIGHQLAAGRWPEARPALLAALGFAALCLTVHAYVGLYRDLGTPVNTARGTYLASDNAAPAIQRTVDLVRSRSRPGEEILVLPDDPGIHFITNRPPALYELTFLPGTLDSVTDERRSIQMLERTKPPLFVLGARRFDQYGLPEIGVDFNQVLIRYLRGRYREIARFGDVDDPPRGSAPSEAFTVYARKR